MRILTRLMRHLSIRGLVVLSVGMTLMPLLMGLASSMMALERLESAHQQALREFSAQAKLGLEVQLGLNDLTGKGWKYALFRDSDTLAGLRSAHEQLGEKLRILSANPQRQDGNSGLQLDELAREEKNVYQSALALNPRPQGVQKADGRRGDLDNERDTARLGAWFDALNVKADDWSRQFVNRIDQQAEQIERQSREVEGSLLFTFLLLLPVAGIVLAIFLHFLHSPMRQIDHFIRTLAAGNFNQPVHVVGTSDVEYLGRRLEWLRTRLNDLELAKQRFVRNVSHEIKTPLATIHEGTNLLMDQVVGELNQEQKHIAEILVGSANKLDDMVAKLINYSQVSAREDYRNMALVNVRQVVLNVLEEYQLQLRGKSIKVNVSLDSLEIMANREQFRTVVDNLLSNAVKYSPVGGEIRVSLRKEGGHMQLEIEDDGPGVDPSERPRVFEPFFQGRASRDLGIKGTGLGLAIVAECVVNHHGKVEMLESSNGDAGALVRVQIPMPSYA